MNTELRILILEDIPEDAELLQRIMSETKMQFTARVVDNKGDFLKELKDFKPDIILSDYSLPQFTGLEALELTKEIDPSTPFIIVTGSINEETAVECIKTGAVDYLIKDHLIRLGQAVEAALENKNIRDEKARVEKALAASAREWKTTFDAINDAICLLDINGNVLRCNTAMKNLVGKPFCEIIGKGCWGLFRDVTSPDRLCPFVRMHESLHRETTLVELNNRWLDIMVDPILDETGALIGGVQIVSDVTERKRDEEQLKVSLTKYQVLFDSFPFGITISDNSGKIKESNKAAEHLLGLQETEQQKRQIDGKEWRIIRTDGSPMPVDEYASVRAFKENRLVENVEMGIVKETGDITWINVTAAPIPLEDYGVAIAYGDITLRKLAEKALQASEALLQTAINILPVGLWIIDAEGKIVTSSAAAQRIWAGIHYVGIDQLGKYKGWRTDSGKLIEAHEWAGARALEKGETSIEEEVEIECFDGTHKIILDSAVPLRKSDGSIGGAITINQDITERKQAEEEREQLLQWRQGVNQLQQSLLEPAPLENKLKNITDSIVRVFDADFSRIWLIRPGDLCERDCLHAQVHEGPHVCRDRDRCLHLLASSGRYTHTDGEVHRRVPFGCHKVGLVASGQDHNIITNDVQNDPLISNHEWVRELGLVSFAGYQIHVPGGQTLGVLVLFARHPILPAEDAMLDGFGSSVAMVIQQAAAEETMRQSEARYRVLFETAAEGILIAEVQTKKLKYANQAICKMLGYSLEELIGMGVSDIHPKEELENVIAEFKAQARGEKTLVQLPCLRKDGGILYANISATKALIDGRECNIGFFTDITNEVLMEQRLREKQKMEAIGTLAGGIAHDFNNILAGIIGYTELSLDTVPEGSQLHSDLTKIFKAGYRARDLVNQILTFSRQRELEKRPIMIAPIIKESLKLLRASLPSTVEIRQNIEPEPGMVMADATQIHQVIMNLCTNAGQAMREKGGILEVTLTSKELDSEFCLRHPGLIPGLYLELRVSDTGHGIEPDILPRIFEPYFTTKDKSGGTGLGLPVVHGIITGYGGTVTVYSEPGKGTTFKVYLPTTTEEAVAEIEETPSVTKGHERILLIDDEPDIIDVGKRILEQLGYTVTTNSSSMDALELFQKDPYQFDLVISDMTMPFMTGDELAGEFMRIRQDIPIIICTGYSEKLTEEKALSIGIRAYLGKPLLKSEIAKTVRRVLDQQS